MIQVIPAIDILGGRCVRLRQGDFQQQTIYSDDPVSVATRFEAAGIRRLHLVDLDGARGGAPRNLDVLRAISGATALEIDFSGGIRERQDADAVLDAGAALIGIGSLAVSDPERLGDWVSRYGAGRFLIGADVKGGRIAVNGWESRSEVSLFPFLERIVGLGILDVFCTDVFSDGMLAGPSTELYRSILERFPVLRLTASGGVRNLGDIRTLEAVGCSGVIVGKALYEGRITLEELTESRSIV